jgi:hypothetical protein
MLLVWSEVQTTTNKREKKETKTRLFVSALRSFRPNSLTIRQTLFRRLDSFLFLLFWCAQISLFHQWIRIRGAVSFPAQGGLQDLDLVSLSRHSKLNFNFLVEL